MFQRIFRNKAAASALLLAALILLVHGRTLTFGYTGCDDLILQLNSQGERSPLAGMLGAFRTDIFAGQTTMYRPLLQVTMITDQVIGHGRWLVSHSTNLLFHWINCLLLLALLGTLGIAWEVSLLASCVFAVHSALAMTVAWIPGRNDLLLALCVMASCLALIKYLRSRAGGWFALHLLALAGALFTKENGTFAVVIGLLVVMHVQGARSALRWRNMPLFAGWLLLLAVWYLMREAAIGLYHSITVMRPLGAGQLLAGLLGYWGKAFWPRHLSPMPMSDVRDWGVGLAALALFVTAAATAGVRDRKLFWGGVSWYLLFLVPAMAVTLTGEVQFMEHRQYLPLCGLLLAVAQLGPVTKQRLRRPPLVLISALLIMALGMKTFWYELTFINPAVFWKTAVIGSPQSSVAHTGLAQLLIARCDYGNAVYHLNEAITIDPTNPQASNTLIRLQKALAGRAVAIPVREAYRLGDDAGHGSDAKLDQALRFFAQGEYPLAVPLMHQYLLAHPNDARINYLLAESHARQGEWGPAAIGYRRSLSLGLRGRDRAAAWYGLSMIYRIWGLAGDAAAALDSSAATDTMPGGGGKRH